MQGKMSRQGCFVGLIPGAWVVLCEKEEPTPGVRANYRGLAFYLQADPNNAANVEYIVQDSEDGSTWTNRTVGADAIVPGGEVLVDSMALGSYQRVLVYSTGAGRVDATILVPEDQASPSFWPDVSTLSCNSYCEVSSET